MGEKPKPLTKRYRKTGEPMMRPAEVETQISEILSSDRAQLIKRINIKSNSDSQSLLDETLVYLLREARENDDAEMFDLTAQTIYERFQPQIERRMARRLRHHGGLAADFAADALGQLFMELIAPGDKADFAQVRFGKFLMRIVERQRRRGYEHSRQQQTSDSLDQTDDDSTPMQLADSNLISAQEWSEAIAALASLPDEIQRAFIMYHRYGIKIDSADPDEQTISKTFNKSEKTIRNWLNRAAEILRDWNEGKTK